MSRAQIFLGALNQRAHTHTHLRPLSEIEQRRHFALLPTYSEARNRMVLFRLLDRNYNDWRSYLDSLLSKVHIPPDDVHEELDRKLLNYLTLVYSIREHFNVSLKRKFKKAPEVIEAYEKHVNDICSRHWDFAFILDFRGYVQHVGLGIGEHSRRVNDSSVTVTATVDSGQLLKGSHSWKLSKLTQGRGVIDLIAVVSDFHFHMLDEYAPYVAEIFFPQLQESAKFYADLTAEAHTHDRTSRMVFYHVDYDTIKAVEGKKHMTLKIECPPNDLLKELGFRVTRKDDREEFAAGCPT